MRMMMTKVTTADEFNADIYRLKNVFTQNLNKNTCIIRPKHINIFDPTRLDPPYA